MRQFSRLSILVSHEGSDESDFSVAKVEMAIGNNSIEVSNLESALSMLPPGSEVSLIATGTVGNRTIHNLSRIIRECPVLVHIDLSKVQELSRVYDSPFRGNPNLVEMIFPGNLATINEQAFADCKNLERVSVPKTVRQIGKQAFSGCEKLNFLDFEDPNDWIAEKNGAEGQKISNLGNAEDNPYRFTLPSSQYRNCVLKKNSCG